MDPIVHSGQYLAGRYQLTKPYEEQLPQPGTQLWAATDKLLGREVRVLVLHPDLPSKQAVVDAARRTALVDDPHVVHILSADDSADTPFVASEIPAGQRLSSFIDGTPLGAAQAVALTGTIAESLSAASQRGLRHLHISPDFVWITPSGDLHVDGVGVTAALDSSTEDLTPVQADRREVRQLLALTSALLTGQPFENVTGNNDELTSAFETALARQDLPEGLRHALERERDGYGISRISDLAHALTPWGAVNPADFHNLEASPVASESEEPENSGSDTAVYPVTIPPGSKSADTPESADPADESPIGEVTGVTETSEAAKTAEADKEADETEADEPTDDDSPSADPQSDEASFDDLLRGTVSSPASSDDPIRVGPNADPTVRAVFPKITAPLGGASLEDTAAVPHSPTESSSLAVPDSPDEPAAPEESAFESTEKLSGTAVMKAVVDPDAPEVPAQTLKPEISAGFAAGLAAASANNTFFTPQWAPSGDDDVTEDTVSSEHGDAEEDAVVKSETPEVADDPEGTADIVPVTIPGDSEVSDEPAVVDETDAALTPPIEAVTRTSVFAAAAEQSGSPAAAPSVTPARPHGEPSVHTFEELGASAPAVKPEENSEPEKQYNPSKVITLGAAILVAVGLIWSVGNLFRPTTEPELRKPVITATPTTAPDGAAAQPSAAPPAEPPAISSVTLLNPQADTSDEDSPGGLPYAWDGNTGTGWSSWWYGDSNFAGKDGVGLEIELAAEADVSEVVLNVAANGGNVQWRNTDASAPSGGDLVAESAMSSETVLKAAEPVRTSTIIIWFNQLPVNGAGENRIELLEIEVR